MRAIILAILCAALAGCVGAGVKVTDEQAARFEPGKSTYEDVVLALGRPTAITTTADGRRIVVYSYTYAQARPATFIPIVGAFAGGADATSNSVVFTFGPDGRLLGHTSTEANTGSGLGVTAGPPQQGAPDQPRVTQ